MAHFAKIDENNIVIKVIVAEQDYIDTLSDKDSYIQTSYNTHNGKHYDQDGNEDDKPALRYNYAGIGYTYDSTRDAFIPPSPFPSWTLVEETCQWKSPVNYPDDKNNFYNWNEENQQWDIIED